jgi:hypothetical protein
MGLKTTIFAMLASLSLMIATTEGREERSAYQTACDQAAQEISQAFDQGGKLPAAERTELYRRTLQKVQASFPQNVLLAAELQAAKDLDGLTQALRNTYEVLTFKIKNEAEMPADFPAPTPVGEIRLKQYPEHRLARTSSQQNSGFFKLLTHITLNRIEMTAPVEITYKSDAAKNPKQADMAFLYSQPTLGKPGNKLGGVVVQDIAKVTTVAVGLKGDHDKCDLAAIEKQLEAWIEKQASGYERFGDLRVLGYNSPSVPPAKRYFEVELPVRRKM